MPLPSTEYLGMLDTTEQLHRKSFAYRLVGAWLSLVEHLVRDQGVGGSNPLAPTNTFNKLQSWLPCWGPKGHPFMLTDSG